MKFLSSSQNGPSFTGFRRAPQAAPRGTNSTAVWMALCGGGEAAAALQAGCAEATPKECVGTALSTPALGSDLTGRGRPWAMPPCTVTQ